MNSSTASRTTKLYLKNEQKSKQRVSVFYNKIKFIKYK